MNDTRSPLDDDDALDALAREGATVAPPAGFADAVVARATVDVRVVPSRMNARLLAAACAFEAVVFAAAASFFLRGAFDDASGEVQTTTARQAVAFGREASAVLEPGALVRFDVDAHLGPDAIRIEQPLGRAFYRVDPGTALTVATPHGDVVVHGTCFTVDVLPSQTAHASPTSEPSMIQQATQPLPKLIATAVAGALVGAGLVVFVYEGEVAVKNDNGAVTVPAGASATVPAGGAPSLGATPAEVARLSQQNRDLEEALVAARQALAGDPRKLADENAALKVKLDKADRELALVDAIRKDQQGEELEPPAELPARFSEQALVKAFTDALKQAGVKGDVTHVDCSEYPCIVYGDVQVSADLDAMQIGEKLRATAPLQPYGDDADNTSWWRARSKDKETGEERDETHFGIALYPKEDDAKRGDAIGKRIGARSRESFESNRAPR